MNNGNGNDQFFAMRRLNYGNISVINPSASNRTAVAGQPWMNFWSESKSITSMVNK